MNGAGLTLGYTQAAPISRIFSSTLSTHENIVNHLQVIPNPFYSTFELNFETISNEQITVKAHDMIGKLIDTPIVEANAINTLQFGENYQAGIYNVTVTQGEKYKRYE